MTQPFNPAGDGQPGRPAPGHHSGREPRGRRDRPRRAAEHLARPARPRHPRRRAVRRPGHHRSRPPGHRHVLRPRRPGRRRRQLLAGGHRGGGSRRTARPGPVRRPCPGPAAARRPGGAAAAGRPRRRDRRAGHRRLARPRLLRPAPGEPGGESPGPAFAACERVLRPGGILAVIAGPAAPGGTLADTAGSVAAAARAAGLVYAQHIVLVRAAIDGDRLAPAAPGPGPAAPAGSPVARRPSRVHQARWRSTLMTTARPENAPRPVPAPTMPRSCACRCGRPPSAMPAPSGAAGTSRSRPRTRPRCCPPSRPPRSGATPSPGTWLPTRCAASAPPWSRPSTLGRDGLGVEYENRWASVAAANVAHARRQGATGTAEVIRGDARLLPGLLPPGTAGRAALVVTSPPYGPSVHGQVKAEQRRGAEGGVRKYDNRYGQDPANLAHQGLDELLAGFTAILSGCTVLLRPGGLAVVTARPWRQHGELVDLPAAVIAAGARAGLVPVARCVALLAGLRSGRLIARPSFFQLDNLRRARAKGEPWHLIVHEDVLIFRNFPFPRSSRELKGPQRELKGPARRFSHARPGVAEEPGEAA